MSQTDYIAEHKEPTNEQMEAFVAKAFDFARQGDSNSLEIMLNYGLNPNLTNHKGNTLLMLACYHDNFETAQLLLERGADPDRPNDKGQTPLAGVCFKGFTPIAELLLKYGADPDWDSGMGLTPLNCAIMFRRKDITKMLLKKSSKKPSILQKLGLLIFRI